MNYRAVTACLALIGTLLGAPASWAQDAKTKARTYFNAGVKAYKAGQFLSAGQAFLEARKLLKKPQLLFSIAQAFRRQFHVDQNGSHLAMAIKYYRQYLKEVKEGGRRLEAARALSELAPFEATVGGAGGTGVLKFATRLMLSSSAPGAVASVDGGPWRATPLSQKVKPGPHRVVIKAPGFETETRQLEAVKGELVAVDVPLRGKPALLDVIGPDGADVTVDGRTMGEVPLSQPLQLPVGRHFVAVTTRGHEPYATQLDFAYGAHTTVNLDLPPTSQRIASYAVFGVSAATLVATGILGAMAAVKQSQAQDILDLQQAGPISEEQRLDCNAAIQTRDDLVLATGVTAGAGAAIGLTALLLYLLDQPEIAAPATLDQPSGPTPGSERDPSIDLLGSPVVAPGLLGVGLRGRF